MPGTGQGFVAPDPDLNPVGFGQGNILDFDFPDTRRCQVIRDVVMKGRVNADDNATAPGWRVGRGIEDPAEFHVISGMEDRSLSRHC